MLMAEYIPKVPDRRLLLVRHSKSDYPPGVPDHDRPLNGRGRGDAESLGRWLTDSQSLTEGTSVLVSSALRTQQTWALAGGSRECVTECQLYEAQPETIIRLIQSTPVTIGTLIVLAHNPGVMAAAMILTGNRESPVYHLLGEKFPTSAVAVLGLPSWREALTEGATLIDFVVPRGREHACE